MRVFVTLAVVSCAVMLDAASLFGLPVDDIGSAAKIGARIGSNVGKHFGRGVDLGMRLGHRFLNGDGNPFGNGFDLMGDDDGGLGLDSFGLGGRESEASGYKRGENSNAQNYNDGASGAENQAAYNAGDKEYHNNGLHHRKTTSISQSEDDGSQNIGGSESRNVGEQSGRAFNKQQNGASQGANDIAEGAQRSDVVE